LAVTRVSGPDTFAVVQKVFQGKDLTRMKGFTATYGMLHAQGIPVDEAVVTVFRSPRSFTGENLVEISTHGSPFVVQQLLKALMSAGARLAEPGEFTKRAFLHGKLNLSQAEAVADLIHAEATQAHNAALYQLRGGYSKALQHIRQELVDFAALIELELDFGEEDVTFANRTRLLELLHNSILFIQDLVGSFAQGRAIKEGIRLVIAGKPNAGKSTLLNALLKEEKALVSAIPGTTRDVVEDTLHLEGILFRLMDTAGLRQTSDTVEAMGVARSHEKIASADHVLLLFDMVEETPEQVLADSGSLPIPRERILFVANKLDEADPVQVQAVQSSIPGVLLVSAKAGIGIEQLLARLVEIATSLAVHPDHGRVTNLRHYQHLVATEESLRRSESGLKASISGELVAQDLREVMFHLGAITGEISNEEVLGSIFSRFCIGK
jgi:tRNA modification GTPase